ncbi:DUF4388 domain-containing protein [Vulgatibacter incomptus]|uniref:DnaJ-class molecular chaperone CbpA n=1 Tax=Vulgatibacter incomptus TaxID=1391653 RepID=A0A0K1PE99_9BACT|nr:DUF4388 domain-containing protein [Vulgatibacter incomptus]AKU91822.1 DnaJ-class molecular chaperone CbpA [Vulgatibacter incomptus]
MIRPPCDLSGGELRSSPFASILIEALRTRATGNLVIDSPRGTSHVYFRGGRPCGVQIFFGFKPLGQFLLELGWIDMVALERSLVAVAEGRKQGEALIALGCITEERLARGLGLHHRSHLQTLSNVTEGVYSFHSVSDLPAWTEEVRIGPHRAILDALAAAGGRATAHRILKEIPAGHGLRLRDGWERYAAHFELAERETAVVLRMLEPRALKELLSAADVDEPMAAAITAAFFLMGIALAVPGEGEAEVLARPAGQPNELERTPGFSSNGPLRAGAIANEELRSLVARGEEALSARHFSQALALFMQALRVEDRPDLRAHVIWAVHADPTRPALGKARQELVRLLNKHPGCETALHYLWVLDQRSAGPRTE